MAPVMWLRTALTLLGLAGFCGSAPAASCDDFTVQAHDGNDIVFFSESFCINTLGGSWHPGTNARVSATYGECLKPQGGSFSWDLRNQYDSQTCQPVPLPPTPAPTPPPPTPAPTPLASCYDFVVQWHEGNNIVFFSWSYCTNTLRGNWYPGTNAHVSRNYGECLKRTGGSFSWDLRYQYASLCKPTPAPPEEDEADGTETSTLLLVLIVLGGLLACSFGGFFMLRTASVTRAVSERDEGQRPQPRATPVGAVHPEPQQFDLFEPIAYDSSNWSLITEMMTVTDPHNLGLGM
eukprot:TRINITY_DN25762_c0_g1_i3.p1 TRINITY_DN25762_c0_g1~~TRINITY_DN25762_c0_g1_i3.p1  ORF type:complete len:292 (+),score=10.76 TRINITY_DN25762_c0_g1_i3:101-976(+)